MTEEERKEFEDVKAMFVAARDNARRLKDEVDDLKSQLERLHVDYQEAQEMLIDREEQITERESEIEEFRSTLAEGPEWGACRSGACEPSYLNSEGWCSPSCALGGKKGRLFEPQPQIPHIAGLGNFCICPACRRSAI
jgi:hypothetical protein